MRFFLIVLSFIVMLGSAVPVLADVQSADPEAEDRGDVLFSSLQHERNIVIITGGRNEELVKQQLELFKEEIEGLKLRDVTLVRFIEDKIFELSDYSRSNFRARKEMDSYQQGYLEDEMHSDNNEFSIVLIGKAGYWARTWKGAVNEDGIYEPLEVTIPPAVIYRAIDAVAAAEKKRQSKR